MSIQEGELGQLRMATTSAESVYSPATTTTGIVLQIYVCNTSASAVIYSVYQDADGSTYSENTALHFEQSLPGKTSIKINGWFPMNNSDGNLAAQTSAANALTVTVHGTTVTP